jgi:amino-acid N-acetyltransferase
MAMIDEARAPLIVRPASTADVPAMVELINSYAANGEMLPKSLNQVYQNIRDFCLAERAGRLLGCGALHVLWDNLGEVRSLAVAAEVRGQGIGGRVMQVLLADAAQLGLPRIFALTRRPGFFARWGFAEVERDTLPRKIWVDCIDCIRFPQCDEVAVVRDAEAMP